MKKVSYLVTTMLENISIATMTMETMEAIIDSPTEVEQIMDDADALIDYIRSVTRKTFFQSLPDHLQTDVIEVANFIGESVREKNFLGSNRLSIPEDMLALPSSVTTESVAKLFEIALCRYLNFTCMFFSNIFEEHRDELGELTPEKEEEIQAILNEISEFDLFTERVREYAKLSFEEYMNVYFMDYDDSLDEAEQEEIDGIKGVASFDDFDMQW